jgi:TatA/E family protein of Tat protein translocase
MLALISDTGIIVLVAALALLFGASHIPKLARNIGEAGKEFRKAHAEMDGSAPSAAPAAPVAEAFAPAVLQPTTDRITLTRAELDALLSAQKSSGPTVPSGPGLSSL